MPTNTTFSYRTLFSQAYQITKKNKLLWFFGFFAAFLGIGGEFESIFQNFSSFTTTSNKILGLQAFYQDGLFLSLYNNVVAFFGDYPAQGILALLLLFVVSIILLWLSIVSQVALFDSAKKLSKKRNVNYQEAYHVGNKHFGSVLLVSIILRGALYALLALVGSTLLSWFIVDSNLLGGIIFVLFVFVILAPLSAVVSFLIRYSIAYITLNNKSALESIKLAWNLFKKNWIVSVEMAVFILLAGLLAGLLIALLIGLATVPFILIGIAALFFGSGTAFGVTLVAVSVIWLMIAAVVGAVYVGFQYTAWTLLFMELDKDRAESRIVRFFSKIGIRRP